MIRDLPFQSLWSSMLTDIYPKADGGSRGQYHFSENEDGSILYVSAPGYKADDLSVEMQDGTLSIKGIPTTTRSVGVLVPKQIDLKFSVHSNYLIESAELKDGLLAVKVAKHGNSEAFKIPVLSD